MKNHFNKIYLLVLVLFFGLNGYAQLFPVQLTPVFKSPYSVKISDYATSMDTKFQLLINPTDVTISQRQVRLKLYIQGNGVNIRSSDYITGQRPIFINGGEFQTLINTDISALFRLENLQGITPAQYANPLPDGMYDFCFEMYDYITNQKISQKSCASIYLILNDPPLLNTPQKNEQIAASDFPNIMFTWTPRQMNATNVSYKFELKQLIDPTLDPQFAFQMAPLLYEETVFSTAMLYNLSMPILTPGMRYAWRVRAVSTTGLSENAIFKNDGYSEIYSFKYTASCASPTFLLSEAQGPTSVKITWQGIPDHTKYQLQYKKQDVRNAQWFSTNSLNTQSLITNLEPGITYQFRVGSSCDPETEGVQSFTYSGISTFTMPTQTSGVPAYNCGIIPKINIQNQKILDNLIQSETFTAGDFPVTVLELQEQHSPYSGRGYIIVPYLNDTRIAVEFTNILINTDYQLISGVVETSYNPKWGNVISSKDFLQDNNINDLVDNLSNAIDAVKDLLSKEQVDNKEEWDAVFTKNNETLAESLKLISEKGNLPQNIKDAISKTTGNTYVASNDKTKPPTIEDFPEAKKETIPLEEIVKIIKDTQDGLADLLMILKNYAADSFIKCKQCEGQKIEKSSGFDGSMGGFVKFSYYNNAYICLIASLEKGKEIKLLKSDFSKSSEGIAKSHPELSDLIEATKSVFNKKQDLLAVISNNTELVSCDVVYPFSDKICGGSTIVDDQTLSNVSKELETCYYSDFLPKLVTGNLKEITANSRSNQGIEFVRDEKVYRLNGKGEAEEVKNPLTDDDVRNGKWTDSSIDVKLRVTQNKEGVFEYQAVGIRNNLSIFGNKKADLVKLAKNIETKANAFFNSPEHKVIKIDDTPAKAGVDLNAGNELFADGDNMNINLDSKYTKIVHEGIGLMTTLLTSGEVEENTYLDSTKPSITVHAPGMVTASVEVVATKVTDLTSLGTLVYDLSVDKQARQKAYTDFVGIKNQIGDDPKTFIPILGEVVLNVSTGNSAEQWQELIDKNADVGKKSHLATRGVENAVITVFTGSKIISELPEISEKLVDNIKKVKNAVELVGKYDWNKVKKYFLHIQEITGTAVLQNQIDKLKDALRAKEYTKLNRDVYKKHAALFTQEKRLELIKEWELNTGQNWPTYTEPYYSKSGTLYKKVGDPYDAHHIIEQNFGGEHEWWNMHPAKFPDEHQGGIHGAGSPARELFK